MTLSYFMDRLIYFTFKSNQKADRPRSLDNPCSSEKEKEERKGTRRISKMMNSSLPDNNKPAWLNDDASLEAPTTPLKATNAAALGSSSSNYGSGNVTKTAGIMTLVL